MRFLGFAAVTGAALVFAACGGGDNASADSAATAMTPAVNAPPAIEGTTHEVKMLGDEKGYRFEPAEITAKAGDGIKFVFVSGGPHNVAFDPTTISGDAKAALAANMPEQQGELAGKMLIGEGETYTISLADMPEGTYDYHCTPHLAMNMKGKITVTK